MMQGPERTLCRSWFRKMIVQLHLEALPAIFLSAWLMSRACAPTAQDTTADQSQRHP